MGHGGKPWVADFNHPHYVAGRNAMKSGMITYDPFAPVTMLTAKALLIYFRWENADFITYGSATPE